jgi:Contractile injection system tube protein
MIPPNLVKARLEEISWDKDNHVIEGKKKLRVQFNPDSLKVNFANQTSGGDQRGGSAIQFVGSGTTKLSFDLWFDVTNPEHNTRRIQGLIPDDVRLLTQEVAFFITPNKDPKNKDKFVPPGVKFLWGRFLFEGIMESLSEELSYFSEDGRPLRAKVSVSLTRQEIQFKFGAPQKGNQAASTAKSGRPRKQVKQGDTAPKVAGESGNADNWPAMAAANGIENPRLIPPGTVLDVSAAAGLGAGAGIGGGASIGFGASASAGAGIGLSASASGALGGGLRAGAAASAGGGIGGGIGGGASAGLGGGASAGIGGGASAGLGAGISGGFGGSAGVSGGFSAGVSGGASVGLGGVSGGIQTTGGSASFGGAAASASARANASFDLRLRR